MKKQFLPILALAFSATACVSDADLDVADNYGYIHVNLSADDAMQTRTTVTADDPSTWTVKVGETVWTGETQAFKAGPYTVSASNYPSLSDALLSNEKWGDAYYEGQTDVTVVAGESATAKIECGTAQNARLEVIINEMPASITDVKVTASTTDSERGTFVFPTAGKQYAYFNANEVVSYTIAYKYDNAEKTITEKSIIMKGAATTNTISVSANDNGTITVTIKYNDEFAQGNSESITIDAATGTEVSSSTGE